MNINDYKNDNKLEDKTRNFPLISVVIPTYNEESSILRCLDSVFAQELEEKYEVIVVDSSLDATPTLIMEKFPLVRLFHLPQKTLPGAARNIGVKEARGKIIAFVDGHCIADKLWLHNAVLAMKESGSLVIGGPLRNANSNRFYSVADFILAYNEFAEGMPSRFISFMPTCNLICTTEAFKDAGGFDENLRAGEDTMFCYELVKRGYKIYFDSRVLIERFNRSTWKSFIKHHRRFGHYSAYVRKKADLPGRIFVRFPIFIFGMPFVRASLIFFRLFRYNRRLLPKFFIVFPLIISGIFAWSYSFFKELMKDESINERIA